MSTVIKVENLSKYYRLGLIGGRTLHEDLSRGWAKLRGKPDPLLKIGQTDHSNRKGDQIWALKDINFEVKQGEILGIIGRNGAGKSTLLKILSKITAPTEGRITIIGRVGSLLEVGTGFHPELTGKENIYLNGAILGMTKREVTSKLEEIVEFSEMAKFIDTPVKRYSSGMTVRLAFAVAAHLEPEILIIDEVLAVGDAAFQKKCIGKMGQVAGHGKTILFVSHNMQSITSLCQRVVWIQGGNIKKSGDPAKIVGDYLSDGVNASGVWKRNEQSTTSAVSFIKAGVVQNGVEHIGFVNCNEPIQLNIAIEVREKLRNSTIFLRVTNMDGIVVFTSWDTDTGKKSISTMGPGNYELFCTIPQNILKPGRYDVSIGSQIHKVAIFDEIANAFTFDILPMGSKFNEERQGVVRPIIDWRISETR